MLDYDALFDPPFPFNHAGKAMTIVDHCGLFYLHGFEIWFPLTYFRSVSLFFYWVLQALSPSVSLHFLLVSLKQAERRGGVVGMADKVDVAMRAVVVAHPTETNMLAVTALLACKFFVAASQASPVPPMAVLLPRMGDLSLEPTGPSSSHAEEQIPDVTSEASAPVEAEPQGATSSTSKSVLVAPKAPHNWVCF